MTYKQTDMISMLQHNFSNNIHISFLDLDLTYAASGSLEVYLAGFLKRIQCISGNIVYFTSVCALTSGGSVYENERQNDSLKSYPDLFIENRIA